MTIYVQLNTFLKGSLHVPAKQDKAFLRDEGSGVFAVNDNRARLGSPALLTKLRSSPLVPQVACCYFPAGGFLCACARGFFCARWRVLLILLTPPGPPGGVLVSPRVCGASLLRTWSRSSFSSRVSTCSGAIPLVAHFLWHYPSVCLPTGEVRSNNDMFPSA